MTHPVCGMVELSLFWLFRCLPDSASAGGNLADQAAHLDNMKELSKTNSTQSSFKQDVSPSSVKYYENETEFEEVK